MNEKLDYKDIFARLAAPFQPEDIEWRAGATNSEKTKAMALAYITSRAVMDRLDEVINPENWKDEYAPGPDGGVICGLSLRINGEWITKWDGAENTDFEAIKGGLSDAFKRVGYKWGIGRYLYRLESQWVNCEARGKTIVLKTTPQLPSWALPKTPALSSGSIASTTQQISSSDREKQILKELGFEDKPVVEPAVFAAAPVLASPSASKGNGNNGKNGNNGNHPSQPAPMASKPQVGQPQPNGKRPTSWNVTVVQAVIEAHLAHSVPEALQLLNGSDLNPKVTPSEAVAYLKTQRNS